MMPVRRLFVFSLLLLSFSVYAQEENDGAEDFEVSGVLAEGALGSPGNSRPAGLKPNILMIMVDDMRIATGSYGDPAAITPNLDRLASQGTQMNRMYAAAAACRPARTSLFSGLRPETTGVTNNSSPNLRDSSKPNTVMLPQWLKSKGYKTAGFCKIFHGGASVSSDAKYKDYQPHNGLTVFEVMESRAGPNVNDSEGIPLLYSEMDRKETLFGDYQCATYARDQITAWKNQSSPWFIAVGLWRPHVPWNIPTKYWDLYTTSALPLPVQKTRPSGFPASMFNSGGILDSYSWPNQSSFSVGTPIGDDWTRKLRHSYYASVSFVDAQVGRILNSLDHAGLNEETIVLFVSDQGFMLGESADWGKISNIELAVRVPAIFRGPGIPANQKRDTIVEHVDLYPTLLELATVAAPTAVQHASGVGLEGDSFVNAIQNAGVASVRAAFTQIGTAKSMRTNRYRYEVRDGTNILIDHQAEANSPEETTNVWGSSSQALKDAIQAAFSAGGKVDLPTSPVNLR